MNISERIVEYTVSAADAAALNNAVSAGDVYPVLVVNRTDPDETAGTAGWTYGHLFYHGGSLPISFQTPGEPGQAERGPEPAAGVNSRATDEPRFAEPASPVADSVSRHDLPTEQPGRHELTTVPADSNVTPFEIPGTDGRALDRTETEAEMEARLRAELTPKPRPAETPDEMRARLVAKIQAEGNGVTGSEGRL